ncbi:MAG TPA: hypothetical protein VJ974_08680 [Geopsychrobacteraceae bacterium]|nr:hypothetical protein [Geopsychrobacteraceae bacterium]
MKKILLLNDKHESLLSINFVLQAAQYIPVLFNEPEELINWAKIYRDSINNCLLINGCRDVALLEKMRRLLYSCDLDLQVFIVGDDLPAVVQRMAEYNSKISCCRSVDLVSELNRFQQSGPTIDEAIE